MSNDRVTAAGSSPSGMTAAPTSRIAAPTREAEHSANAPRARGSRSPAAGPRAERPAPSAERSDSSRVRTVARASSRFATLAQQMSEDEADDAEKEHRRRPQVAADQGIVQRLDPHAASLVRLADTRAPGHRPPRPGPPGPLDRDALLHPADGLQRVASRAMRDADRRQQPPDARLAEQLELRSERTPTTVKGSPSNWTSRPTMVGSLLKRVRQSPSLMTMALARRSLSSCVNVRPTIGFTPEHVEKAGR